MAHANRGIGVVFGDESDGGFQIRDGLRREDYFAAREPTRLRTSSMEAPLPASMSRIASSSERSRRLFFGRHFRLGLRIEPNLKRFAIRARQLRNGVLDFG